MYMYEYLKAPDVVTTIDGTAILVLTQMRIIERNLEGGEGLPAL